MWSAWLAEVPPSDRWRATPPADLLKTLTPALWLAGITRVAELTRLDRIGMPVFQAIRPMSRALSVHQGKGATEADARVSAIMEAVESAAAEQVAANGPRAAFDTLPPTNRMATLSEYGPAKSSLAGLEAIPIHWHEGVRVRTGQHCLVPFDVVTQDFSATPDTPFIRSSTGLAAGATAFDAMSAAAFELVEREAQSRWLAAGMVNQALSGIDTFTIDCGWFRALREHLQGAGLYLSVYALHGLGGLPVVICRIDEPGIAPSFAGAACRLDAADALLRAFGEAAQSRLTIISGARDDIAPDEPKRVGDRAIGPPTHTAAIDWHRFAGDTRRSKAASAIDALLASGYDVVRIDLEAPIGGIHVVKLIASGLCWSPEMLA